MGGSATSDNVSPLNLIWDDENYYLVGFDEKAGKMRHYRVDKIRNMRILDKPRSRQALDEMIDPVDFSKKTFGMFGGVDETVRFTGMNYLAGVMLDRFGTDIWMRPLDADYFSAVVTVTVSPQFFGWMAAIGKDLEIAGPEHVRKQYEEYLKGILEKYS